MTDWQAFFIALLQGATELFPVSSLGHAVVVPALLHWAFRQADPSFVPFLTLLHLGTATALVILYWRDWLGIVKGFVRGAVRGRIEAENERLAMLLLAGTIPGGLIGFLLERPLKALFATPRVAALFLILNGAILLTAEALRRRSERRDLSREEQEQQFKSAQQITFKAAFVTGGAQALALLPGISRSGVTICGGLLAGLRHQEAARFSFLLATPIIAAAGLLEVPQLFSQRAPLALYAAAAVVAGLAAYISARFLIRYFRAGRLDPYGWYCAAFGLLALILLH
ncbi:MAG: undecaprenyl-diphosphate phosphatase [Candidatus Dormibacteraeota bacterium]|nr:undecaprenyl-diphosphate phosphatase [Candidatus Dormibacteraeota bacterium]